MYDPSCKSLAANGLFDAKGLLKHMRIKHKGLDGMVRSGGGKKGSLAVSITNVYIRYGSHTITMAHPRYACVI